MNDFLSTVSKVIVGALSVIGFIAILLLFLETSFEDAAYISDSEAVRAWLNEMESEKEDSFKAITLKNMCASEKALEEAWCIGYVLGFSEGHGFSPPLFCPDDALGTASQTIQSFNNFMDEHPQHWEKSRHAVLGAALQKTFPCDESSY